MGLRNYDRKRLWVEVVGARNLECRQALDAYCVLQLLSGDKRDESDDGASPPLSSRSLSVQSSGSSASWPHAAEFELTTGDGESDAHVLVKLFNEKNFFFDMFPASSSNRSGSSKAGSSSSSSEDGDEDDELDAEPPVRLLDANVAIETDSEDGDDEHECGPEAAVHKVYCDLQIVPCFTDKQPSSRAAAVAPKSESESHRVATSAAADVNDEVNDDDEPLGFLELSVARFSSPSRIATDAWYRLRGTHSGEVRIRTLCVDADGNMGSGTDSEADQVGGAALATATRESLLRKHLYEGAMRDHYGFKISESAREEWAHLRSYEDCREQQRVSDWEQAFGTQFFSLHSPASMRENVVVRQLTRAGIPRSWRQRVYMNISGKDAQVALRGLGGCDGNRY